MGKKIGNKIRELREECNQSAIKSKITPKCNLLVWMI